MQKRLNSSGVRESRMTNFSPFCDDDLVAVLGCVAGEQLDVTAELLVGRHAVAVGRGATVGGDGVPVVVGQQRVALHRPLGGADAVDGADLVEDLRVDRAAGGAHALAGGERRLGADHHVGARADLAEELVERDPHRVGEDQRPGQQCDAEGDRCHREKEAQLVRHQAAKACGQHGQAPRFFM